jgi:hypothetical protein
VGEVGLKGTGLINSRHQRSAASASNDFEGDD